MSCGGSGGDGDPPPVLDLAREQVAEIDTSSEPLELGAPELPAPDPSTFEGAHRVVNLWVGADGETTPIDVWSRRTFTDGPVLLAEEIGFGESSDYFSAPPDHDLVIVNTGAGADGEERAGLVSAANGEQVTTVFTNSDKVGGVSASALFEFGRDDALAPPAPGTGTVVLSAPNLAAFSDDLVQSVGGDAFHVGDGSTVCRIQRVEATGAAPNLLDGTSQVELAIEPGPTTISLHPAISQDQCDRPAIAEFPVDVTADRSMLVLVFSSDGRGVDALILPVAEEDAS